MAADLGPTTSYSDPFYDRLDAFAQWLKRAWLLVALVLVVVIAGVVALNWFLERHPDAGSAARFVAARDVQDDAKREAAFKEVADDAAVTAPFRARALIEIVQIHLGKGDTAGAGPLADKALEQARASDDTDVQLAAKLTRAAVYLQAGELDPAGKAYGEAKRAAGAKYTVAAFEAALGLARVAEHQGKLDDAINELEPLIARNDAGAQQLLGLTKVFYWDLKRRVAEAKLAPAAPAAGVPAALAAPVVAPAAAAPVAPAAPAGK